MQATTEDLKKAIYDERDRKGKYAPVRQRLTLPALPGAKSGTPLAPQEPLKDAGLHEGSVVVLKDLGPQARRQRCPAHLPLRLCMSCTAQKCTSQQRACAGVHTRLRPRR